MLNQAYQNLLISGRLSPDENQQKTVLILDEIGKSLIELEKNSAGIASFFKLRKSVPKGLYIYGTVGRGKTLLMDLFFNEIPIKAKRRVHFHQFMDEMHQAIADYRQSPKSNKGSRDPIPHIIKPIIRDVRLLCFDEFHVNDITNAMLLSRLFEKLFHAGIVIVATSNNSPEELYKDGLNRQLFLPFIDLLKAHTNILCLDGNKDYRLANLSKRDVFFFGKGKKAKRAMDEIFTNLSAGQPASSAIIKHLNRKIIVPTQSMGVARFSFKDLCEQPLSSRDYLKIAQLYHTIIIDDIPQFNKANSNEAKRFILMIDVFYDSFVKLVASFAAPLDKLSNDKRTAFEFKRTISRLNEMNSAKYLGAKRLEVQNQ